MASIYYYYFVLAFSLEEIMVLTNLLYSRAGAGEVLYDVYDVLAECLEFFTVCASFHFDNGTVPVLYCATLSSVDYSFDRRHTAMINND